MRALAALAALAFFAACGGLIEPPPPMGRPCAADTDCVPNACCGLGTGAVHRLDGPDCSAVDCTGSCPATEVNCGCGLPICRDSQCTVAVAIDPGC